MTERVIDIVIKGKNLTGEAFAKARKELAGVSDATVNLGSTFSRVSGALAGLGIYSAISGFAELTGQLTDLSAKTGIGVEALQRLKYAAEQNGGTLEQVTGAISKLGANLAGGNQSAVGALDALGLKFSDIRNMAPDQAFTTIADAISKIPDPMAQSKLAMDLFGKSGADLLPMMKGNLSETAEAASRLGIVLSEEAVRAGDEFGDTLGSLASVGKACIAQVLEPMVPALTMVAEWLGQKLPSAVKFVKDALTLGLGRAFLDAKIWINEFILGVAEGVNKIPLLGEKIGFSSDTIAGLRSNVDNAKDALAIFTAKSIENHAAQEKTAKTISTLNLNYGDHESASKALAKQKDKEREAFEKFAGSVKRLDTAEWFVGFKAPVSELSRELEELPASSTIATNGLTRFKEAVSQAKPEVLTLGQSIKSGLSDVLATVPGTLARAFEGGGNWLGAAKSIGSQFGSSIGRTIGESFKSLGSLGGPIGSALGSLAGPLIGKIAGLFTDKNKAEVQKYNTEIEKVRQSLIDAYGPLDELDRKAQSVGLSFKDAWGHQGQAGLAAMNSLSQEFKKRWDANAESLETANRSLATTQGKLDGLIGKGAELGYTFDQNGQLVKVSTEKMREVAQKYGVDLKALGPAFDQADLNTRIQDVVNAFTLLDKGGTDTGTILEGMKDEINAIVRDSLKFGTSIPSNMKPWIQSLIDAGKLTDENGNKIDSLSKMKFGDPIKTQFEEISGALKDVVAELRTIAATIAAIPTNKKVVVETEHRTTGTPPGATETGGSSEAASSNPWAGMYDANGDGRDENGYSIGTFRKHGVDFPDFGTGFDTRLHGREAVVPYSERYAFAQRVIGGGSPTSTPPVVNIDLRVVNDNTGPRLVTESEFRQIQARINAGGIQVPVRNLTQRTP